MKITGVFPVAGQVHVLMTDEKFSADIWKLVRARKKIRVTGGEREVMFSIQAADVIVRGCTEFISFVVPSITDKEVQDFILDRSFELC